MKKQLITIVAPFYNEEVLVEMFYKRLVKALDNDFSQFNYELIFVDDGSVDTTFAIIQKLHTKDKRVKGISFSRNFGHHIAITAGLDVAEGDLTVIMDSDLQDRPEEIIKLFQKLNEGYDIVYAVRQNKQFNPLKRKNNKRCR